MMKIPFLDLSRQHRAIKTELLGAVERVLDSSQFVLGGEGRALEGELAALAGVRHGIGLGSGTDALRLALIAVGVGPGDEVITPAFSFVASASTILMTGATPVFVDVDAATLALDPDALERALTPRTRAVIVVHLYGHPAPIDRVLALARARGVPVVEDAAQAVGASRLQGRCACFSFFPSKNLGGFGDAGALATDDAAFADRVRLLRAHGSRPKYVHHAVGGNFRIDTLQAALLRVKLPHLAGWTQARRANADRYRRLFADTPGLPAELRVPEDAPGHIYNQFVIRAPDRDRLRAHLTEAGVATEIYYPLPFHRQPCFRELGYTEGAFPQAEKASLEALALPIYPELTEAQQAHVVSRIAAFYRGTEVR